MIRLIFFLLLPISLLAQAVKPHNGIKIPTENSYIISNVTILVSPEKTIENGTVVVREGKIISVEKGFQNLPKDIPIIDGQNGFLIPAFIELNSQLGMTADYKPSQLEGPYYWNSAIHPEYSAIDHFKADEKTATTYQKMGFGLVLTHLNDGIAQGYGSLIQLGVSENEIFASNTSSFYSFHKGKSSNDYPSSLVGSIALIRQALYDASWHKNFAKTQNFSLDALNDQAQKPAFFALDDKHDVFRIRALEKEFNRSWICLGSGQENLLPAAIWDTIKPNYVIPLNFTKATAVQDPFLAHEISYNDLLTWYLAPQNPAYLSSHQIPYSCSANGIDNEKDFWSNIHKALSFGWTIPDALRALTLTPATFLQIQQETGTIEKGKWANFSLYDKNPFLHEASLLETYGKGERTIFNKIPVADVRGLYSLNIDGQKFWMDIKGSPTKPEGLIRLIRAKTDSITHIQTNDTIKSNAKIELKGNDISIFFAQIIDGTQQTFSLKGEVNNRVYIFEGEGLNHQGIWIKWSALRNKKPNEDGPEKTIWTANNEKVEIRFPNNAAGLKSIPKAQTIIFEDATIWTNEQEGIIPEGTVVVENGKIKAIHKNTGSFVKPADAIVINAKGKILTCGIIDEHSHIALTRGVNEGGQAISCEVRMQDAIDPEDINIYRQLSGGVTAAQLLHGSANPIGGQSALIKLKWGHLSSDYLIKNAPKFVKFALGENVKQSNWGNRSRFPQTRMGVEQVYIDAFSRAKNYEQSKAASNSKNKDNIPPAVDLELEALQEIIKGERKITCHSYVQSEINMLMHIADSFGFKVNTFTHILEGYKVADLMKKHGVGASTFSDWWAYKFEVMEAIPQNASLLTDMGITTAINSDDAEMGRRLNQEAAKSIKYGGATMEEAWKMVTLNPAKLLHLDDRMGSVKVGKDADLVLWTTNPLSITAKVLYTVVDGEILYDAQQDFLNQQEAAGEKMKLLTLMQDALKNGAKSKPFVKTQKGHFHCNTLGENASFEVNEH